MMRGSNHASIPSCTFDTAPFASLAGPGQDSPSFSPSASVLDLVTAGLMPCYRGGCNHPSSPTIGCLH